jgi:tetratricopeptide (TPR) repeat protein
MIFANILIQQKSNYSLTVLNFVTDLACDTNQLSFLVESYRQTGQILSQNQQYEESIKVFKNMLKVIWIQGDIKLETKVYENLALQYFYLQDLVSCKKYQDRALRGKLESNQSLAKIVTLEEGTKTMKKTVY